MDEYINRDDLLKAAWGKPTLSLSVYDIGNIKPVDVAPVRHGRWVQCKYMDKSAKCSECGGYYTRFTVNECYPKYCLHCGAKMDGKLT